MNPKLGTPARVRREAAGSLRHDQVQAVQGSSRQHHSTPTAAGHEKGRHVRSRGGISFVVAHDEARHGVRHQGTRQALPGKRQDALGSCHEGDPLPAWDHRQGTHSPGHGAQGRPGLARLRGQLFRKLQGHCVRDDWHHRHSRDIYHLCFLDDSKGGRPLQLRSGARRASRWRSRRHLHQERSRRSRYHPPQSATGDLQRLAERQAALGQGQREQKVETRQYPVAQAQAAPQEGKRHYHVRAH
mmetsp:Transcript_4164/g.10541  ORF Transcript_4164/g.10541 Transcript_4164/m.10541 type:complete len:243 (-) Transcript_4164:171-899(-)